MVKMESLGDAMGLQPPSWVMRYMGDARVETKTSVSPKNAIEYSVRSIISPDGKFRLISLVVPNSAKCTPEAKQASALDVYELLSMVIREGGEGVPVRFWNFFPEIVHPSGKTIDGIMQDNYMMYCAGRSIAMEEFYGGFTELDRLVCTATGIGNDHCDDFSVHCLVHEEGMQVENPRQVPAYKYSKKFGSRAPSFSRATISEHPSDPQKKLFITAGTASVLGEETAHIDDWKEQTHETLRNLFSLLREGCFKLAEKNGLSAEAKDALEEHVESWPPIGLQTSIRVYVRNWENKSDIAEIVEAGVSEGMEVEYFQATVCRPNLLVEIEAMTEIDNATCFAVNPLVKDKIAIAA